MHRPVLVDKTISFLVVNPNGIYVDCTAGGGGHLKKLLNVLEANARVIAIDKDRDVLEKTGEAIKYPAVRFVHSDYRYLGNILAEDEKGNIDGILLDLGVSSFQLDESERGFSFHEDARLDMRMNRKQELTARDIVNTCSEEELAQIIFKYGEERYARRIAAAIAKSRQGKSIDSTLELVQIIKDSVPAQYKRNRHPARKTFQALRIAVNDELEAIKEVLPVAVNNLKQGGRLCVITFHSLEDRLVKVFMQEQSKDCVCPPGLPICTCNHRALLKVLTRKPVLSDEAERISNPRARSAKLRVAVKL